MGIYSTTGRIQTTFSVLQKIENCTTLATTATSTIASTVTSTAASTSALSPSAAFFAKSSSWFLHSAAVPALAIGEGFFRIGLGISHIRIAFLCDKDSLQGQDSYQKRHIEDAPDLFAYGVLEIAKGLPAAGFGMFALATLPDLSTSSLTGAAHIGFIGLAITNSLDLLEEIYHFIKNPERKEALNLLAKGIETAGWWLLVTGNPLGSLLLAAAFCYKLGVMLKREKKITDAQPALEPVDAVVNLPASPAIQSDDAPKEKPPIFRCAI